MPCHTRSLFIESSEASKKGQDWRAKEGPFWDNAGLPVELDTYFAMWTLEQKHVYIIYTCYMYRKWRGWMFCLLSFIIIWVCYFNKNRSHTVDFFSFLCLTWRHFLQVPAKKGEPKFWTLRAFWPHKKTWRNDIHKQKPTGVSLVKCKYILPTPPEN